MAKVIKYNLFSLVNYSTDETPTWKEVLSPVVMGWNEINEEIAKREAYNGEYIIEDDGGEEPVADLTSEERIAELEEALELLLSGVTE